MMHNEKDGPSIVQIHVGYVGHEVTEATSMFPPF
jgi:hypothetical protein